MKLIVGLGNPGIKYNNTRHNLGFMVVDTLAENLNIKLGKLKYKSLMGQGMTADEKITLAKPMTYMNLSGQAVCELMRRLYLDLADLIVICDDLNLPLGSIRIRTKGSAGGHNGLSSIIGLLGSNEFTRIRLGIDRPVGNMDTAYYVLKKFKPNEYSVVEEMIAQAQDAVVTLIKEGANTAMNKFN